MLRLCRAERWKVSCPWHCWTVADSVEWFQYGAIGIPIDRREDEGDSDSVVGDCGKASFLKMSWLMARTGKTTTFHEKLALKA